METWLLKVFRSELEDYAKEGRELHLCCLKISTLEQSNYDDLEIRHRPHPGV